MGRRFCDLDDLDVPDRKLEFAYVAHERETDTVIAGQFLHIAVGRFGLRQGSGKARADLDRKVIHQPG